jgi:hypothetical protein
LMLELATSFYARIHFKICQRGALTRKVAENLLQGLCLCSTSK